MSIYRWKFSEFGNIVDRVGTIHPVGSMSKPSRFNDSAFFNSFVITLCHNSISYQFIICHLSHNSLKSHNLFLNSCLIPLVALQCWNKHLSYTQYWINGYIRHLSTISAWDGSKSENWNVTTEIMWCDICKWHIAFIRPALFWNNELCLSCLEESSQVES